MKVTEAKTRGYILAASKRAEKSPAQATQARQEARTFAKELVNVRKQAGRLHTAKAQLQSVEMQVNEAYSIRKIEGSLKVSAGIMKDVNTLVKLPEISTTMQELSQELMKAGIIEEMVGDMIESDFLEEDEEAEAEVDAVLGEVLKGKLGPLDQQMPALPAQQEEEEEAEDLETMRGRLEALKS